MIKMTINDINVNIYIYLSILNDERNAVIPIMNSLIMIQDEYESNYSPTTICK